MDIEKAIKDMEETGIDIWQVVGNLSDMLRQPPDLTKFLLAEEAFRACIAQMDREASE